MRTALFWVITQQVVVTSHQRFAATSVVPKRQQEITTTHQEITQKSVVLKNFVAEA